VGATLTVTAGDLFFEPAALDAAPGTVTIELVNQGSAQHTFVIEEAGDTTVADAAAGETATGSIDLEAGTYTIYCDVPGHREGGMEGTLTVG
jgi:plastocyanin